MTRSLVSCMLTLAALLLVGCGGYTLSGKVISGAYSDLEITSADDSRFSETGVGQVKIMVHRDPLTLNQKLQATGRSHTDGTFEIPISGFGAGWMDETWLIEVERGGYSSGQMIMRLPTGSSKLLITVSKGPSMPHEPREDLWEQYEKYK